MEVRVANWLEQPTTATYFQEQEVVLTSWNSVVAEWKKVKMVSEPIMVVDQVTLLTVKDVFPDV